MMIPSESPQQSKTRAAAFSSSLLAINCGAKVFGALCQFAMLLNFVLEVIHEIVPILNKLFTDCLACSDKDLQCLHCCHTKSSASAILSGNLQVTIRLPMSQKHLHQSILHAPRTLSQFGSNNVPRNPLVHHFAHFPKMLMAINPLTTGHPTVYSGTQSPWICSAMQLGKPRTK